MQNLFTTPLAAYPDLVRHSTWVPVELSDSFSGASVWRGERDGQPLYAMKAWPPSLDASRLVGIHQRMRQTKLEYVPAIIEATSGNTVVISDGHVWDVTAWMPGVPRLIEAPTREAISAACVAVAGLHRCWVSNLTPQPPPAVLRRLNMLNQWEATPLPNYFDRELTAVLRLGHALVRAHISEVRKSLSSWANVNVPIQTCLCDLHAAHVLFEGDRVRGIIDYGAMKLDTPAVDLARLLADCTWDNPKLFWHGVDAYQSALGSIHMPDPRLIEVLAKTMPLCAVANWHLRLSGALPPNLPIERIKARIGRLLGQLERM